MNWVQAAIAIVGSVADRIKTNKQAHAAERQAETEARIEERITSEKLLNLRTEERTLSGETKARAAASGVRVNQGSPMEILAEQAATFAREREFVSEVGGEKSALITQRGKDLASAYKWGHYVTVANMWGSSYSG